MSGVVASGNEDQVIAVVLAASDPSATTKPVSFRLSSLPPNGILYLDAALTQLADVNTNYAAVSDARTLYFKPNANFTGDVAFNYAAVYSGPIHYYLDIAGVDGGCRVAGHEGAFEVSSFDVDLLALTNALGTTTGLPQLSPLNLTLASGASLSPLLQKLASGAHIIGAQLEGFDALGRSVYDLRLADIIVKHAVDGSGSDTLSLDYVKVSLTTTGVAADGSLAPSQTFGFDRAATASTGQQAAVTPVTTGGGLLVQSTPLVASIHVVPVNDAPSSLELLAILSSIAENSSTAEHIKVADVSVVDVDGGNNVLSLTGADASFFEVLGNSVYLKAGAHLDFETKASYSFAVAVDDPSVGLSPDATSSTFTLSILNVEPEIQFGSSGADRLIGGPTIDIINGGSGGDQLDAGAGNDTLTGGLGKDFLTGGAGSDVFKYTSIKDTGKTASTRDVITDFKHGQDKIDLSAIDAISGTKKNDAFHFIGNQSFHSVKGELHFLKLDKPGTAHDITIVEGDVNGDGKADFQIELSHLVTLTKGDFIL